MTKTYTKLNVLAKGINISCAAKTSLNVFHIQKAILELEENTK